jgi:hypothetical protein
VFQKGVLIERDVVATIARNKYRGPQDDPFLIEDRYIVFSIGDVYDLKTKTLLGKYQGRVAAYFQGQLFIDRGDSVIYVNIDRLKEVIRELEREGNTYALDLATGKYRALGRPNFFSVRGLISPDFSKKILIEDESHIRVWRRKTGASTGFIEEVITGTYKISCGKYCKEASGVAPVVWIDKDRFLTQKSNGELIAYDFRNKQWTQMETIPLSPDELTRMPRLSTDADGNVIYIADKAYLINVDSGKYSVTDEVGLGHGFRRIGLGPEKLYMYQDRKVGKLSSKVANTTEGYIAVEHLIEPLISSSPRGVLVWSVESGAWSTIELEFEPEIIGWISK